MFAEFTYQRKPVVHGYSGRTLYVNVGTGEIKAKYVSEEMKRKFIGGKGFNLWLLWNSLPKDRIVKWNDPENELCIACGPLGGNTMYPGSGKSIALTICPLTGSIIDSNVGGYFGPYLKFSGWDALEIQGKADRDVVVFIDGDRRRVTIEDAPPDLPEVSHLLADVLTRKYGGDSPRSVSVVSAGPGAERSLLGCLNFSWYDVVRNVVRFKQAGRGGTGTVLRDKKVAAIVAKKSYTAPRWVIDTGPVAPAEEAPALAPREVTPAVEAAPEPAAVETPAAKKPAKKRPAKKKPSKKKKSAKKKAAKKKPAKKKAAKKKAKKKPARKRPVKKKPSKKKRPAKKKAAKKKPAKKKAARKKAKKKPAKKKKAVKKTAKKKKAARKKAKKRPAKKKKAVKKAAKRKKPAKKKPGKKRGAKGKKKKK
jgi:hypothetical protein